MFIVKKKSELVRFGLFLTVAALMAYYLAGKFQTWRASNAKAPAQEEQVAGPILQGPQATGLIESAKQAADGSDFFAEFRMNRDRHRSVLQETLKAVVDNQNVDADTRKQAGQQLYTAGRLASLEDEAENMIRAKGFDDVLVKLNEGTAEVVVKASDLNDQQYLIVVDMTTRLTGIKAGAVHVMARTK